MTNPIHGCGLCLSVLPVSIQVLNKDAIQAGFAGLRVKEPKDSLGPARIF